MLFVCATVFVVVLSGTMLPVALPAIGESLTLGPARLGWLITGFFLVNGVAIPFFGRLGDLYGVRRVYAAGMLAFFLGSLVCAMAPVYSILMAGRLVQGAGAAAVVGLGSAAVSLAYDPRNRGTAIGMLGATAGVGAAIGPVAGGVVTDFASWRYLFVAGILFCLLVPFASRILPHGEAPGSQRLDLYGGMLLGLALAGLLLALTEGANRGWGTPLVVWSAFVAAAASGLLVVRQRTAENPFIPRQLLTNRFYVLLVAVTLLFLGINITIEVALPLLLAEVNDLPPSLIGFVLLPQALTLVVCGPIAGRLADRAGVTKPVQLGAAFVVVALLLLSSFGVGGPVWLASALAAVISAGTVFARIATTTGVSLAVEKENLASGLAINEMSSMLGVSVGTALFSATLSARSSSSSALNFLHTGPAVNYSDAFLMLAIPLSTVLLLSIKLSKSKTGQQV
ncbi:MFS transporter [soil metagenome]